MISGCDTLWCCWMELMGEVGRGVWAARWPLATYAVLKCSAPRRSGSASLWSLEGAK